MRFRDPEKLSRRGGRVFPDPLLPGRRPIPMPEGLAEGLRKDGRRPQADHTSEHKRAWKNSSTPGLVEVLPHVLGALGLRRVLLERGLVLLGLAISLPPGVLASPPLFGLPGPHHPTAGPTDPTGVLRFTVGGSICRCRSGVSVGVSATPACRRAAQLGLLLAARPCTLGGLAGRPVAEGPTAPETRMQQKTAYQSRSPSCPTAGPTRS